MTIMSALVFYVIPGMLGRSYDLKNETVGPDIFEPSALEKAVKIDRYMTTSEYRVVSDFSEASDFLDVTGKLALKLKIGATHIEGTGNYLKETKSFQNKVDLLVKVHYETVILTLPTLAKPIKDWDTLVKGTGNTHYIRSIRYGGDLIASVRFVTSNEADKEIIKGEIQGELKSKSGSFGGGLKGNLEKIQQKISDSASMDINYYATVPLKNIPRTIDGLTSLVEKFPEQTKNINNGYGVPLGMEVFSLESLNKDASTYYQTIALSDQMAILDDMLSDIRNAKTRLADWLKIVPPTLSKEEDKKIGEFNTKLEKIDRAFCEVIGNLNLTDESGAAQFLPAFAAYKGDKEEVIPDMYVKDLSKLKKEVMEKTPSFETDFGGSQFTYWGSDVCPSSTKQVYGGFMSTTNRESVGSSQFLCMPNERQYYPGPTEPGEKEDIEELPQIQEIALISRKKGGDGKPKSISCGNCRVPGKTATTMLSGQTECPDKWVKQYEGVLVSTDYKHIRGELICLDTSKASERLEHFTTSTTVVTEVSPDCNHFPCASGITKDTAVPCVVCSIIKPSTKTMRL